MEELNEVTPSMNTTLSAPTAPFAEMFAEGLTPKVAVSYLRVSTRDQAYRGGESEGEHHGKSVNGPITRTVNCIHGMKKLPDRWFGELGEIAGQNDHRLGSPSGGPGVLMESISGRSVVAPSQPALRYRTSHCFVPKHRRRRHRGQQHHEDQRELKVHFHWI